LRRSKRPLIIASRKSALAKAQAQAVGRALSKLHPGLELVYKWIESEGDQLANARLADAGGKGLFAKAVEAELLAKRADIAVHSLKDLPVEKTIGLSISAIPHREDPRDCLVSRLGVTRVEDLPRSALVGTASPRRAAQLLQARPDLKVGLIRGNVETRLRKVLGHECIPAEETAKVILAEFDATLLAIAGLNRLGLQRFAASPVPTDLILPAAAQGALAIQCRSDDHVTISRTLLLNDPVTSTAVHAERQVIKLLQGDCHSPVGVLANYLGDGRYAIQARVISGDGSRSAQASVEAPIKTLGKAVNQLVKNLQEQGASQILSHSTWLAHAQVPHARPATPD
jgi:hydroxymethylbilane synthase